MPHNKNDLAKALNLENLTEGERAEILAKVDKRLEEVLIAVLVANITDDDAQKIQKALHEEGADLEEVVAEISARIPNLATKIERAVEEEIMRLRAVLVQ
ncbi:hypothetical protein A3I27_04065 [Candidatus Giovannonibacteria bacterium RIFCSPLOWO2_02_FULL_43_11b]|uniref:Uncharacterized protein n=1 Tax=Candidatus Giovannonibacteria bacterium RIFCSPHIGHO2_12_FULL_43_15 TaxID=1798341 RepID=A0A1F5WRS7_9BACT|nr:MAG: hypothetical protein A2739_02650 [Candidatus Giovannonibacteria bacterium RIFCSPHIGHO2_01_FULL_43_100]OGF67105.1 MAG: hypothetical protein A3B97_04180 [Candidatus Giovannonibacteria bacterium RIFCSPHIGHO2_02_FULL_43_32]OGF77951.1 MAG: hypothetical protein A3F23_03880 [Candidatus Giovannonibacteria bacterium RIFCSPHIGHO2_12_FULL_43_15]OGF79303.1 MAG: hypothetical protein A3A15_01525 [Candidatus Giovannonibacteria bacterium RIFCSPLOWO2_01_FULL_43_60]OGF89280.1 MAG: hypothetical protein A3